jgi:hypothetical protein
MKQIAGENFLEMQEAVDFLGFSRSTVFRQIRLSKKGKITPPLPFFSPSEGRRHTYFFRKDDLRDWMLKRCGC